MFIDIAQGRTVVKHVKIFLISIQDYKTYNRNQNEWFKQKRDGMMGPRLKAVQQIQEKGEYNLLIVGLSSAVYYDEEVNTF